MSLIDTSFDDATPADAPAQPLKVEPLISSQSASKQNKQSAADVLDDFSTTAAPPVAATAEIKGLDDLMSFSPSLPHKVATA